MFDELRRGVQQIEFLADPTVGEVLVGGTGIPDGLARCYPRITVRATEAASAVLYRMLRARSLDLAVSRIWRPEMAGEDFATEFLFDEYLFAVAGRQSRWARRRKIRFDDLLQEPWVMPESDNAAGVLISQGFEAAGVRLPAGSIISNSMAVRTRLAATGQFLTILPGSMLHFAAERLALAVLPVQLPLQSQTVEIITLKNRAPNAVAKMLIAHLLAVTRPLRSRNSRAAARQVVSGTTP